jgi:hypothetical protein
MRIDLGIGPARGASGAAGGIVINPNLLVKTEAFDAADWVKSLASVAANAGADPLGGSTADQITNATSLAAVSQTSSVVAATGTATANANPVATWTRFAVMATLDIGAYTFSAWLCDPLELGAIVRLRIDIAAGFVRCRLLDSGDLAVFLAWGAKLEIGSAATGTAAVYGAVG